MDYNQLIPILINAFREQQEIIERQELRIAALERR